MKQKNRSCISLTEGLFESPLYLFIDIRLYLNRLKFLIKHGG